MILCTICARGGSKGLPGKNLKPLLGEPLIAWTIKAARESGLFDTIAVSSDDINILYTAQKYGAHFMIERPKEMASDTADKIPAIVHAVEFVQELTHTEFDTAVDLDVTSPLRLPDDIIAAVNLQKETKCSNVISVTPAHRNPAFNLAKMQGGFISLYTPSGVGRRQDAPIAYDLNASIYCWDREKLIDDPKLFYDDTRPYVMPPERSVDIDTLLDFEIVEMIMRKRCLN